MAMVQAPVSDMLVTVKSREVQRAMLAQARGDQQATARHLRAAAHLELVLAEDYTQSGDPEMARRSRISAASCLWRCGNLNYAQEVFDNLLVEAPERSHEIQELIVELRQNSA